MKLPEEAKKIEIFPKFQKGMKKKNNLQASFIILEIWKLCSRTQNSATTNTRDPYGCGEQKAADCTILLTNTSSKHALAKVHE